MRFFQSGFTLIQLLLVIAILAVLATIAYPAYQSHVKNTKLRAAHAALLENAHFMERFFKQKGKFKKNSTSWPELPVTATDTFCIRSNNIARGALDSQFTLKAVAFDTKNEPRVLKINESLAATICESSTSSCDTDDAFFRGSDANCEIFQP